MTIICGDWGTSSLRLRLVDPDTQAVLAEVASDRGIAPTHASWQQGGGNRVAFYEAVLLAGVQALSEKAGTPLAGLDLVLSGMASSSIGMLELPYKELPFRTDGTDLHVQEIQASQGFPHRVLLVSGVKGALDVMRGEETQLVGCEARDGLFIFPGTHSKHILVAGGWALGFKTYMTGEFLALLTRHSLLASSVEAGGGAWFSPFREGVADSLQGVLLHTAFRVRVQHLFGRRTPEENYHYLSGLLIGTELKDLPPGSAPTVVGDEEQRAKYLEALRVQGKEGSEAPEAMVKGQCEVYKQVGAR